MLRIEGDWHMFAIVVPRWNYSPQTYAGADHQHWISEAQASTDECSTMEPWKHVAHRAGLASGRNVVTRWASDLVDETTRCREWMSSMVEQLPTESRYSCPLQTSTVEQQQRLPTTESGLGPRVPRWNYANPWRVHQGQRHTQHSSTVEHDESNSIGSYHHRNAITFQYRTLKPSPRTRYGLTRLRHARHAHGTPRQVQGL